MPAKLIGLVAHVDKPGARELVRELHGELSRRGADLRLETRTAALIGERSEATTRDLGEQCEILLVLGGDGTILQVLHDLGEQVAPVFGINLGSLGFLTCVSSGDYLKAVDSVFAGDYVLSERSLLEVDVFRDGELIAKRTGLNDAVISRGELSRLIKLETRIDGRILTEYNADGLIVSTATGSTAYSLAAGGPILTPSAGVFIVTPICPHVLTNRSVIVSDQSQIDVAPRPGQDGVFLTVDGQELLKIRSGDHIQMRKSARSLPLAMLPQIDFFDVLRTKLRWGGTVV